MDASPETVEDAKELLAQLHAVSPASTPIVEASRAAPRAEEKATLDAVAKLQTARNLIRLGKIKEARGWLQEVVEMNASPETVAEAKSLLSSIAK
jgi:FimV-like protein